MTPRRFDPAKPNTHADPRPQATKSAVGTQVVSGAKAKTIPGTFDYTLKKQTGGPGQYARVIGHIEPCEESFSFENRVKGSAIPPEFIKACERGFQDAMDNGVLAGYPVIGIKVVLEDGRCHPVDSTERAFRYAACQGVRQALESMDPVLMEPVMMVQVTVPATAIGPVQGDLMARRGVLVEMDTTSAATRIHAEVPLAEMFGYATQLRSLSAGKGTFSMAFNRYGQVPKDVQAQLV